MLPHFTDLVNLAYLWTATFILTAVWKRRDADTSLCSKIAWTHPLSSGQTAWATLNVVQPGSCIVFSICCRKNKVTEESKEFKGLCCKMSSNIHWRMNLTQKRFVHPTSFELCFCPAAVCYHSVESLHSWLIYHVIVERLSMACWNLMLSLTTYKAWNIAVAQELLK